METYLQKWQWAHRDYLKQYQRDYYQKNKLHIRELAKKYDKLPRPTFRTYRKSARKRGYTFELSFEQFMTFWQKSCYYCGAEIKRIGMDRIDNSKGYILSNLVPCCKWCNEWKRAKTQQEYIKHCKDVAERF